MASVTYLEHYLDSLHDLPNELKTNFNMMNKLDLRALHLMRQIDTEADYFLPRISSMNKDLQNDRVESIQDLFNTAKECCDDKVQLAIQTYELVDKHIRRLDYDLARFDAETREKAINARASKNAAKDDSAGSKKSRKKVRGHKKRSGVSSEEDRQKKKHHRSGGGNADQGQDAEDSEELSGGHPSESVLDMPVDPNEPTYCLCHQVSYGEMIGCDNLDCPIEWFHFSCVNLTVKPRGKWYCPRCIIDRKKK